MNKQDKLPIKLTVKSVLKSIPINTLSWVLTAYSIMKLAKYVVEINPNNKEVIGASIVVILSGYLCKLLIGFIILIINHNTTLTDILYSSLEVPLFRIIICVNAFSLILTGNVIITHLYNMVLFVFERV